MQAPLGCQSVNFLLRVGQTDDRATLEIDFFFEKHCFFIYTAKRTACCRYYECTEWAINLVNAAVENFVHRASSLVAGIIDLNLEDIACASATVSKRVFCIDCNAIYEAFIVAQLAVNIG